MKKTAATMTQKCDLCGKKCEPIEEVRVPMELSSRERVHLNFRPYVLTEDATSGHICDKCFRDILEMYVKSLEPKLRLEDKNE